MLAAFEIGKRSLLTQQRGLDVTGNNIANVNTPGYTRQEALLKSTDPFLNRGTLIGTGVMSDRIRAYREQFLDKEMRSTIARNSGFEADEKLIQRIETALKEPSDNGIDSAMDSFFKAVEELNSKPDDLARRMNFTAQAQNLAQTFNGVGEELSSLRAQTYQLVDANVQQMNRLLGDIAEMNKAIITVRSNNNDASATYLDKQSQMLEELSKFGDVQISRDENGVADVTMNGTMVVSNINASTISLAQDVNGTTGEVTAKLTIKDRQGNVLGNYTPQTGELASSLKHFNTTLDDRDSSGGFSIWKHIDTLADAFATKVNALAQTGYGLSDTGATPPGRTIFTVPASGTVTARSIAINPALISDPSLVPTSSAANEPGNNDVLRAIGQLVNDAAFVNGQTARSYYALGLTKVANLGADASNGKNVTKLTKDQILTQREAMTGVNIDEEAVNMIKFQRAFEAAARVISTSSEMLQTIVNLGK
ncbi:MAG: flagellar hook-associated protein FlgK [Candidatus Kapabacteria bacterium]|nr:flagellar hook-associated protein FlgK [Candidatus Kapabacteria bacterium]